MATQTLNYNFSLPVVDGSEDLWGDLLNQNWSDLDALLLARDQGFAALEGRTLTAGNGLTGGGDLSLDRTFTLGTPGTLNGGTSNSVTVDSHTHAITSTASRTDPSTTTLLQAAGMNTHRTSGDHDSRYAQLAGGAAANFTSMPQVGGDPVVESGSNSDGFWTRWADGTQVCWSRSLPDGGVTSAVGSIFSNFSVGIWNYPNVFIASPNTTGISLTSNRWVNAPDQDGVACSVVCFSATSNAAVKNMRLMAIGRWK